MRSISIHRASLVGTVLALFGMLGPGVARAQPGVTVAVRPAPDPAVAQALPPARSPGTALALELAVSAGSIGLLVAADKSNDDVLTLAGLSALMLGPSMGHFYAGQLGRGLVGTGLRGLGGLAVIAGFICSLDEAARECDNKDLGQVLLWGGAAVFVGATLYSLIDGPLAVRRANAARDRQIAVMPGPVRGPGTSSGPGMHLHLRF